MRFTNAQAAAQNAQITNLMSGMSAARPANAATRTRGSVKAGLPLVYVLPDGAGDRVQLRWLRYLTWCFTHDGGDSTDNFFTALFSFLRALWPNVLRGCDGEAWRVSTVSRDTLNLIDRMTDDLPNLRDVADPYNEQALDARRAVLVARLTHLPTPDSGVSVEDVALMGSFLEFGGLAGIFMMAASKDAGSTGDVTLMNSRPSAVAEKYALDDVSAPSLVGELRPSLTTFIQLNQVWIRASIPRKALFSYMAEVGEMEAGVIDEAAFTTFRLMKWANHAHVAIITDFLAKFPDARWCPQLLPYVTTFFAGMSDLYSKCPVYRAQDGTVVRDNNGHEARNMEILPFLKPIYGDTRDLLKRNQIEPLLYVARHFLMESSPTLSQYVVGSAHPALLQKVENWFRLIAQAESEVAQAVEQDVWIDQN